MKKGVMQYGYSAEWSDVNRRYEVYIDNNFVAAFPSTREFFRWAAYNATWKEIGKRH